MYLFTFKEESQTSKENAIFTIRLCNRNINATGEQRQRLSTLWRIRCIRKFIPQHRTKKLKSKKLNITLIIMCFLMRFLTKQCFCVFLDFKFESEFWFCVFNENNLNVLQKYTMKIICLNLIILASVGELFCSRHW